MEQFLQQYGLAILTVIIIAMLVIMATPIGSAIQTSLEAVIKTFLDTSTAAIKSGTWIPS